MIKKNHDYALNIFCIPYIESDPQKKYQVRLNKG